MTRLREGQVIAEQHRVQRERAAFGDTSVLGDGQLGEPEVWWAEHYQWLKDRGYLLRSRYEPGWVPSWQKMKKNELSCEDSSVPKNATRLLDGTRLEDGQHVALKIITTSTHPHEIDIARFFSTEPIRSDPLNHCVPVYDVFPVPDDGDKIIIVMPLLREYTSPPFITIGEAVECFRQLFKGLQFMHKHRVAHRDCMHMNIMMDAKFYIDPFHPVHPVLKRDYSGYARFKTRTERPPKYYFIDFGLSRKYGPSIAKPLEFPIRGGDKEVPEFIVSDQPQDPFPTDVFYIGNAIKKDFLESKHGFTFMEPLVADMVQTDPAKRPTMDEVVARFEIIMHGLGAWKLRSRISDKHENVLEGALRATKHWIRQLEFFLRRLSAIPHPP